MTEIMPVPRNLNFTVLSAESLSHPFLLNAPARAFICGGTPDCQAHEGLEVTVHR